jgi:hypothetical protein
MEEEEERMKELFNGDSPRKSFTYKHIDKIIFLINIEENLMQ